MLIISYSMLKLTLSDNEFPTFDFGKTITVKIFNEDNTAFNAAGYTAVAKGLDKEGIQVVDDIAIAWTTQASGIGTFAFTSTKTFSKEGIHLLEVQLIKTDTKISTERKKVYVYASPE